MARAPESALDLRMLAPAAERGETARANEAEVLRLFDASAPALLRYVGSFGLQQAETEDVVQDVFLALFRHLECDRPRDNLRGWLFRVAHNLALKRRRQLKRHAGDSTRDAEWMARQKDPSPDPEARVVGEERQRRLQAVLRSLPERERECVVLRGEGLRYREIATVMGISLGGVAKRLARAFARLSAVDRE